jgi:hypothetical protein
MSCSDRVTRFINVNIITWLCYNSCGTRKKQELNMIKKEKHMN